MRAAPASFLAWHCKGKVNIYIYIYIYVNILVYMIHEGFIPLFFWRIDDLNYEPCMPILFVGECSLLLLTDGMIPTIPKVFLDQRS